MDRAPEDRRSQLGHPTCRWRDSRPALLGTPADPGSRIARNRACSSELTHTLWNAGGYAPQWIQLDLGEVRSIGEIDLSVAQLPGGMTDHRLMLAGEDGVFSLATEFQGSTAQFDVLAFAPEEPVDARFVRVETVASPSWVAWWEIQVWTPGTLSH